MPWHNICRPGELSRQVKQRCARFWSCVQISKKLACGDVGNGALAEPVAIAEAVRGAVFPQKSRLQEKTLSIAELPGT